MKNCSLMNNYGNLEEFHTDFDIITCITVSNIHSNDFQNFYNDDESDIDHDFKQH